MDLFYDEIGHLLVYFIAVLVIYVLGRDYFSRKNVFVGLATAFFIDVDHLFDYFLYYGLRFNVFDFFSGSYFRAANRVVVPFHSWEIAGLIGFIWMLAKDKKKYSWVLFLAVGYLVHLSFDVFSNGFHWYTYFLFLRISEGFPLDLF
ncbi:hypothetical protein JXA34_01045 [Patescibacteria group bacterium]|nr:hypothetical protein [Patescibacteria group bacterium]